MKAKAKREVQRQRARDHHLAWLAVSGTKNQKRHALQRLASKAKK